MLEGDTRSPLAGLTDQDWNIVTQMIAERRVEEARQEGGNLGHPRNGATSIRRDAALPQWNGQPQDFSFFIGRLETRIKTDYAPFFDPCSICLDIIDTIPDNLKPRVANWFENAKARGEFDWKALLEFFRETFADKQAQQSASEMVNRMEQGLHQYFVDFLQEFEYRMALSGGEAAYIPLGKTVLPGI